MRITILPWDVCHVNKLHDRVTKALEVISSRDCIFVEGTYRPVVRGPLESESTEGFVSAFPHILHGQAKVKHSHNIILDAEVVRLYVLVQNAVLMHLLKSCEHLDRDLLNRESLFERVLNQVFVDRVLYVLNLECRNTLMEAISIVLRYVQEVAPLDYSEVVRFSDHRRTMVSAILPLNFECDLLLSLQVSVEVNDAK